MNRIETLHKANNLTQQSLAEKLGVHQTAVSQWELEDTMPRHSAIVGLCTLFNVTSDYLLGISDNLGSDRSIGVKELLHKQMEFLSKASEAYNCEPDDLVAYSKALCEIATILIRL